MTEESTSRMTLVDLITLISNTDLPKARKQDISSAIRMVGKVLNCDLSRIPADPGQLRRRLDLVSPEAEGISPRRWANIRSLLGRALEQGRDVMPSRSVFPILPAWLSLIEGFSRSRQERVKPLLRYLSELGIDPNSLTLADLRGYRDAILNDRLRGNAEKTWDLLLWLWNKCVRETPGWPQLEIPREDKREIYVLPWDELPAGLQNEIARYLDRQSGKELSEEGPLKPWRPSTSKTRLYQLRAAISALVLQGVPLSQITSLAVLVRYENYEKICRFFYSRRGGQTTSQVAGIATCLKDLARHWVKVEETELNRIKKLASRLAMPRRGMTAKNRQRLRPLDDPEIVTKFLDIPYRIWREMPKTRGSARNKAVLAQVGVAILILQTAPIRIKNLAEIDLNKNLISRGDKIYLVFDGSQVKNNQPIDFELPEWVVEMLVWYLKEHRPVLLNKPSDAFFPGANGGSKHEATLGQQISKTVYRFTGMEFNPHLFRHAGGKIFLDINPGEYEVLRRVFGHKSLDTTTSIYTGAETRSAGQYFATTIADRLEARQATSRTSRKLSTTAAALLKPKVKSS
jgi:integrase